ncbi:hypothetical protein OnM2_025011 [Erysiphe neolycopersici]|uniref:Uncharacterized protein n=1 Tax=Erysiphe neolycopersici TaxID=212602 RepID=A0A420I1F5_9PEZI|nr:hypothetical protein OnM2_025011 [Erysiphe neolycopersici]
MESAEIVENETTLGDRVNTDITPTVNLSKENPSNEMGYTSQRNLVDPNGTNDNQKPKVIHSKKKKRKPKKGKNKDALSAPQNKVKDEIQTHESEPEKSGEVSMDSDKEEHKKLKTEVLLDQPSIPATQEEHGIDPTVNQRKTPKSKDNTIDSEASEAKLLELANLGTIASNVEDVNSIIVPENTLISLSNTVSITSESMPQDTSSNLNGPSEILHCNPSFANDDKKDKINVQEITENIKEFKKLKNTQLDLSSTDESAKEDTDIKFQSLTNNPISETGDFKTVSNSFVAETASISPVEHNVTFTPIESESRSLVPENTSIESMRDAAINKETSDVKVQNEDSITPIGEFSLASTSKILMNLEDKTVKDIEQTLSTINLSELNPGIISQEPEFSTSTQLKETDMRTQAEKQTTDNIRDDNNKKGITRLRSLNDLMDVASELLNLNSESQITSTNDAFKSNPSVNAESSEVRDLLDSTIATNEHITREVPDNSGDVRHIVQSQVSILESSTVLDGNIISNMEIEMSEPPALAEETITHRTSLTDSKESNEEVEVIETNSKETTNTNDAPFGTDRNNDTKDKVIGSDEKEIIESIGDISTNEEVIQNHSESIQIVEDKPSCLCSHSKTLKEHDKEPTLDPIAHVSDTEERSTGSQNHAESTINEISQLENWKNPLESTTNKAMSLIDTKVTPASNLIGMLRHSKSEFSNSGIVTTNPSDSKNDEIHSQNSAQISKIVKKSSEKYLSSTLNVDISKSKENSDPAVDLNEVNNDFGVSSTSPTNEVFGSSASLAEINNKTKLKFKPSVGEQALAPELVTISKETLDLLYKRLDSMQLEIERLSSALKSQNETSQASFKDKSNSSLKDDYVITESGHRKSKIIEGEEIINVEPLKQSSRNKSITKPLNMWRLISIFGFKNITKSDAGLVTRSMSENLLSPSPQGPKGKGKEIIDQPNKPPAARTYKVIGRVRAKHDLS